MKRLFFLLVIVIVGCATVPKCPPCPPEDAYTMTEMGFPVLIPRGYFDDPNNWFTEQQIKDVMEKRGGL